MTFTTNIYKLIKNLIIILLLLNLVGCSRKTSRIEFAYITPEEKPENINVALVLSGGGARGLAHLGVLEVLEEHGIKIDLIVGTSSGSIIGALYADNPNAKQLQDIVFKIRKTDLVKYSLVSGISSVRNVCYSLFNGAITENALRRLLSTNNFNKLKIPFVAVVTDVCSGTPIGLRSGDIARAVRASCAIPGLFAPVFMDEVLMVDGGLTAPVPVQIAKQFNPKVIIASDVGLSPECNIHKIKNVIDLLYECMHITYNIISQANSKDADVLIKPEVQGIGVFCDDKNLEILNSGRQAALNVIDKIKEKLKK